MANGVTPTNPTPPAVVPATAAPAPAPTGVGATPNSLSSAEPAFDTSSYWETVKGYASSITEFIRNLVLGAIQGIRSALGTVAGWMSGPASPTATATDWEIRVGTTAATTAAPQAPLNGTVQPAAPDPFDALPINPLDMQNIFLLFRTMATSSWLGILAKKTELEQRGIDIAHVHPLKFLDYIFRHPTLPKDIETISQSSLTWNPFVAGLAEKLTRTAATIPSCKPGFARSLNINLADIEPFFANSNWDGLSRFLIDVKTGKKTSVWIAPPTPAGAPTAVTPAPAPIAPVTTTAPPPAPAPIAPVTTTAPLPAPAPIATVTTTAPLPVIPVAPPAATTAPGIALTPALLLPIADLRFEAGDDQILTDLLTSYATSRRAWIMWNQTALATKWDHLGSLHPLKVLAALYSKPALMGHLQTIYSYWGTKGMFMSALTVELSRKAFIDVRPYLDDFCRVCTLDPARTRNLAQNGNWHQIVDNLLQSHQARV